MVFFLKCRAIRYRWDEFDPRNTMNDTQERFKLIASLCTYASLGMK